MQQRIRNIAERYKQIYEEGEAQSGLISVLEQERGLNYGDARAMAIQYFGQSEVDRFEGEWRKFNAKRHAKRYALRTKN